MPSLVRYMINKVSTGFAIGAGAATLLLLLQPERLSGQPMIAVGLYLYAFGAPVALGFLASALLSDDLR